MLFYKQYKEKLWIYIFNKKNNYLIFSIIIFIFLSFNKAYSINLCDKLAALEADPRKTSKPVLFEDLDAKKIITNCTNDLEKAKNSENISRFYLQRARGFLKIGSINDAISDLNKSYEFGYPAAAFALASFADQNLSVGEAGRSGFSSVPSARVVIIMRVRFAVPMRSPGAIGPADSTQQQ